MNRFARCQDSCSLPGSSQAFFKRSAPFSWHISSCGAGLCPSAPLWCSSTPCTVPFAGTDEPDEDKLESPGCGAMYVLPVG